MPVGSHCAQRILQRASLGAFAIRQLHYDAVNRHTIPYSEPLLAVNLDKPKFLVKAMGHGVVTQHLEFDDRDVVAVLQERKESLVGQPCQTASAKALVKVRANVDRGILKIVVAKPEVADAFSVAPDDVEVRFFLAIPNLALGKREYAIVVK